MVTRPVASPQVSDQVLRSALDFAFAHARTWIDDGRADDVPPTMRALARFSRLPASAATRVRAAIDADDVFRLAVADAAGALGADDPRRVDEAGMLWLRRPDGWEDELARHRGPARPAAAPGRRSSSELEVSAQRAERRRAAAESALEAAQAEIAKLRAEVQRERERRAAVQQAEQQARTERDAVAAEVIALRAAVRHSEDRERAARAAAATAAVERDEALGRARDAEAVRDAVLAERAAAPGDLTHVANADKPAPPAGARRLTEAATAARRLAEALELVVAEVAQPGPVTSEPVAGTARARRREPVAVPGSALADPVAAAEHLLRVRHVLVIVDGYNVAKLGWPEADVQLQRELCVRALEDLARRMGTEILVVFDGAAVVGAHSGRRLVTVRFSPAGVSADDVIRDEVARLPADRPLVVVTNDRAVITSVRRHGANVVASDVLLALSRR